MIVTFFVRNAQNRFQVYINFAACATWRRMCLFGFLVFLEKGDIIFYGLTRFESEVRELCDDLITPVNVIVDHILHLPPKQVAKPSPLGNETK